MKKSDTNGDRPRVQSENRNALELEAQQTLGSQRG